MKTHLFCWVTMVAMCASPALGQFLSGSDGTDGILDCPALMALDPGSCVDCVDTCTVQINLALAIPGDALTTPGTGDGVYDAGRWAVVFKYISIDIPAGFTVTFKNHSKGAPVVWLAQGDVTIAGTVRLDGADGSTAGGSTYASPGPGGFSGGIGRLGGSAGFGPGGGGFGGNGGGGGYGLPGETDGGLGGVMYGTPSILPLIGGSGGGADNTSSVRGGGAGGGAILIASSSNIFLPVPAGGISAKGGEGSSCCPGSGSGGGIRLIANGTIGTISGPGSGMLQAVGGTVGSDGGLGRIRVEAPNISLDATNPAFTQDLPGLVFPVAPAPSLRVTAVNGKPVPADPQGTVITEEVAFSADFPVTIEIELQNMPEAAGMLVDVRVVQGTGGDSQVIQSMPLAPDGMGALTAEAVFDFTSPGNWEVQLSLLLP